MAERGITIYGATEAGVAAAVEAKTINPDLNVRLIEPGNHVGGMVAGGLSYTDLGDVRVLGGFAKKFYQRLDDHYGMEIGKDYAGPEPHVAKSVMLDMLSKSGVEVEYNQPLESIHKLGGRVVEISTNDRTYQSDYWIDASYEGDLMAAAGVSYDVGRDGADKYGEPHFIAGRQAYRPGKHNFIGTKNNVFISPHRKDGQDDLLPLIRPEWLEDQVPEGAGDGGVMAYQYRLSLTDREDNRVEFEAPDGYMADDYELLLRYAEALGEEARLNDFLGLIKNVPGDKADGNSIGPISLNLLDGSNWSYPDANRKTRQEITQRHLNYIKGFCYTLVNNERIPEHVRTEFSKWGLAKDEFQDTDHWPHQLYVREARRMIGGKVLTMNDIYPGRINLNDPPRPLDQFDSVMMGSYNIDIREVQRVPTALLEFDNQPIVVNEGYLSLRVRPYQIPYRSFIPKVDQANNLIVPVCASMSHPVFASFRMAPDYMKAGHVAGVAAALAHRSKLSVQQLGREGSPELQYLQRTLQAGGMVTQLSDD